MHGNINELGDFGREPGKSYLFFLTAYQNEKKKSLESD